MLTMAASTTTQASSPLQVWPYSYRSLQTGTRSTGLGGWHHRRTTPPTELGLTPALPSSPVCLQVTDWMHHKEPRAPRIVCDLILDKVAGGCRPWLHSFVS